MSINYIFNRNQKLINKTFNSCETQTEVKTIKEMLRTLTLNIVLEENNLEN